MVGQEFERFCNLTVKAVKLAKIRTDLIIFPKINEVG
jgi:hypothetical protein